MDVKVGRDEDGIYGILISHRVLIPLANELSSLLPSYAGAGYEFRCE